MRQKRNFNAIEAELICKNSGTNCRYICNRCGTWMQEERNIYSGDAIEAEHLTGRMQQKRNILFGCNKTGTFGNDTEDVQQRKFRFCCKNNT